MERAVEERKPGREGGRHDRVIKGRQNRLARTSALEEEDDLALGKEDHPAVDRVRDDRLDTVGEELLCAVRALRPLGELRERPDRPRSRRAV
jgi:hypothetical protein